MITPTTTPGAGAGSTSTRHVVSLLGVLAACGPTLGPAGDGSEPQGWMLGVWSNSMLGNDREDAGHLRVDEDGTLLETAMQCGVEGSTVTAEYLWTLVAPNAIEITNPDGGPMDGREDPTYLVFRGACESFADETPEHAYIVHALDGRELHEGHGNYSRGEFCFGPMNEWNRCRVQWCEGEPPAPLPCP